MAFQFGYVGTKQARKGMKPKSYMPNEHEVLPAQTYKKVGKLFGFPSSLLLSPSTSKFLPKPKGNGRNQNTLPLPHNSTRRTRPFPSSLLVHTLLRCHLGNLPTLPRCSLQSLLRPADRHVHRRRLPSSDVPSPRHSFQ